MNYYHRIPQFRKTRIVFIILISIIILLIQFIKVQIIEYDENMYQSRKNSVRQIIKKAPRGIIFDRKGIPLVDNRPIYDLSIIPGDFRENFNFNLLAL